MKQERKEELMVRWMDGELSTGEMEELQPYLEAEPELREMQPGHRDSRKELQRAFRGRDVPYGDFFQTKLARAIQSASHESAPVRKKASWRDALRWSLAPVTVGAMALAFLAGTKVTHEPIGAASLATTVNSVVYTPEGGVSSNYFQQAGSGTSVILLEGLRPLPDEYDLMASGDGFDATSADFQLVTAKSERVLY